MTNERMLLYMSWTRIGEAPGNLPADMQVYPDNSSPAPLPGRHTDLLLKEKETGLELIKFKTKLFVLMILIFFAGACCNNRFPLTPAQYSIVKDSVQHMTESIAANISREGPIAWIPYFENSSGFFMAADGQLVFPDNASATDFIKTTLVKSMPEIKLHWSHIRIDPLTSDLAVIAATFHEDITDATGKIIPQDGYFTAIAHHTSMGWKLHNAHWSTKCDTPK